MRILFLITSSLDYPYGVGRCGPWARELARLGHQVCVAALHPALPSLLARTLVDRGVTVRHAGPMHVRQLGNERLYYGPLGLLWAVARGTWGLSWQALLARADAIHIGKSHPMNGLAGLLGKWLRGRRLYLDCDDYEAESNRYTTAWQKRIVSIWEDGLPRFACGITTNTRFTQQRLEDLGYPPQQIVYLPNGVERDRFAPLSPTQVSDLRRKLGLEGCRVIGYVGSLSLASHGVDLLLRAFALLKVQNPAAVLLLVGGGEDYGQLRRQAVAMGLEDAVRFVGHVPAEEVPTYYALAEVTVDPVYDDLVAQARAPLKIVESLAAGIPVVTGDVGDRREMLADGAAGVLVPPGDAEALASGLAQVLDNAVLAQALSQGALAQREGLYWDCLVDRAVQLYEM